jgi:hypothetical protein
VKPRKNKEFQTLRTMTSERMCEIRDNPIFRRIAELGRPDHTALKREAESFARWIARQHRKERATPKTALA